MRSRGDHLVDGGVGVAAEPEEYPIPVGRDSGVPALVALRQRGYGTSLAVALDEAVYRSWRDVKVPCDAAVAVARVDPFNNPLPKIHGC